ncbi:MAG TPA: protein-methionine-sulfoxide reductase catalytic subunit MsrP, partial [Burkholderiaceae bacterium]|nr:protein-methionine-sulfoxide reductase catalytic subunit MsrP [Burkholderiaceae bacterium]
MLIQTSSSGFVHPKGSDITPREVFQQRRQWLQRMAALGVGTSLGAWAARDATAAMAAMARPGKRPALAAEASKVEGAVVLDKPTAYADVTG